MGVCDSAAWTVLAHALGCSSLLAEAQVGKAGISICSPRIYGVDLRVENGQEAMLRECVSAFWAAVISALQSGL